MRYVASSLPCLTGLPPSTALYRPLVGPWTCPRCQLAIRARTGATMTAVKVCSICTGAIVGFGNDAQPINDGRCCDRCHAERVVPERARRMLERDAKREGNGGRCNASSIIALIVGFAAGYGIREWVLRPPTPSGRTSAG